MRMHCLFCKSPCFLLRKESKDYSPYYMQWECHNHTNVDYVRHYVYFTKKAPRNNRQKIGIIREFEQVEVKGKLDNGNIYRANWRLDYDENPGIFQVFVDKNEKDQRDWGAAIRLDEWPAEFTPENVKKKISTYLLFA